MNKHVVARQFCFMILLAVVVLAVYPVYSANNGVVSLNYATFFPAPHRQSMLAEQWCKEIEKRTNGKLKITYFPAGSLIPAAMIYDGVVKGIADIGFGCFAYTRGRFPLTEVIDLPIGPKDGITATRLINEYYKNFKPKEMDDVKVLYLHAHSPGVLHTKKPVNKLEDLKGMKITANGLAAKIVSALGGCPVGTTMPETYITLSTGVAEGSLSPFEALHGFKIGELVRFSAQINGSSYSTGMFVVMNKSKWNSLPSDIQKVFTEVSDEWVEKHGRAWDEIEKEGMQFAVKRGNKIIQLSTEESARWTAAMKPILDDYVKNTKAKGLPGDEALRFCSNYLRINRLEASAK